MVDFFIKGLAEKALTLNVESYLSIGFQECDIIELKESFFPKRKVSCKEVFNDPISELILCYEHTLDNIVYFEFSEEITIINEKFLVFGYYDDNPLVIDRVTNEVINLNAHFGKDVLYKCAADPYKFLQATLARIQTEPIINKFKNKKEEDFFWTEVAKICTEKAGGANYNEFYRMICDISIS